MLDLVVDEVTPEIILFRYRGIDCEAQIKDGSVEKRSIRPCEEWLGGVDLPVKKLAREFKELLRGK